MLTLCLIKLLILDIKREQCQILAIIDTEILGSLGGNFGLLINWKKKVDKVNGDATMSGFCEFIKGADPVYSTKTRTPNAFFSVPYNKSLARRVCQITGDTQYMYTALF